MKTQLSHSLITVSLAGLAVLANGCALEDNAPDAAEIAAELEKENGGLDMEDEVPLFASDADFSDDALAISDVPVTDDMEQNEEVAAYLEMADGPDAELYQTTVIWGRFPGDLENEVAYNWSGTLSVNRGAIIIRSVLAFDGLDRLEPRVDPRVVAFRSATRPHRDGLRLSIVDPDPRSEEPLVLRYRNMSGEEFTARMDDLRERPRSREMDEAGNRIVAFSLRRPVDVCAHGFVGGLWHKVAEGRGRILGRVVNGTGDVIGHVRGIYGQRRSGDRVFFAKYIDRDGRFMGILRGTYGDGEFAGRWLHREGDRGAVGGEYRETRPGPRPAGHFLGRWAETTCNLGW